MIQMFEVFPFPSCRLPGTKGGVKFIHFGSDACTSCGKAFFRMSREKEGLTVCASCEKSERAARASCEKASDETKMTKKTKACFDWLCAASAVMGPYVPQSTFESACADFGVSGDLYRKTVAFLKRKGFIELLGGTVGAVY
jgi:hypothetical protein